jgi:transcriptional regulator with PAS, ATPase and Fis domain
VFPLVKAGTFDADLYYRLNTILLELTDTAPES